jgi:hypothetical protein
MKAFAFSTIFALLLPSVSLAGAETAPGGEDHPIIRQDDVGDRLKTLFSRLTPFIFGLDQEEAPGIQIRDEVHCLSLKPRETFPSPTSVFISNGNVYSVEIIGEINSTKFHPEIVETRIKMINSELKGSRQRVMPIQECQNEISAVRKEFLELTHRPDFPVRSQFAKAINSLTTYNAVRLTIANKIELMDFSFLAPLKKKVDTEISSIGFIDKLTDKDRYQALLKLQKDISDLDKKVRDPERGPIYYLGEPVALDPNWDGKWQNVKTFEMTTGPGK